MTQNNQEIKNIISKTLEETKGVNDSNYENFFTEDDIDVMYKEQLVINEKGNKNKEDDSEVREVIQQAIKEDNERVELVSEGVSEDLLRLVEIKVSYTEDKFQSGVFIIPKEVIPYIENNISKLNRNEGIIRMIDEEFGIEDEVNIEVSVGNNVKLEDIKRVGVGLYRFGDEVYDDLGMTNLENYHVIQELINMNKEFSDYTLRYIEDIFNNVDMVLYVIRDYLEYLDNQPIDRSDEDGFKSIQREFKGKTKDDVLKELYHLREDLKSMLGGM